MELGRLKKEDCKGLIEFLNRVFTEQNKCVMTFEKTYPRIFREKDREMGWHMAAKIDGKICGTAASYPVTYRVGGTDLRLSSGGNIAVDSSCRGQGIMQKVVARVLEECREDGFDMCYLHGDRWRYGHFGYERCGVELNIQVKASKLKDHTLKGNYTFVPLTDDDAALDALYEFYNTQRVYEKRERESFFLAMTSKGQVCNMIYSEEGELLGYFRNADEHSFIEIALKDKSLFIDILKKYVEVKKLELVYLNMPIYHDVFKEAVKFADRYTVFQPGNFVIINFKKVAEAYFNEKNTHETLPDGSVTIDSEVFGKWEISKEEDKIEVKPFEGEADFILPGLSAYQFVFGTLSPLCETENKEKAALAKAWFPLPLYAPYLS